MATATAMSSRQIRKLWTPTQIADLIGDLNPKTISAWIKEGYLVGVTLPGIKGESRVYREDLRAFLEDQGFWWALEKMDEEEGIEPGRWRPERLRPPTDEDDEDEDRGRSKGGRRPKK